MAVALSGVKGRRAATINRRVEPCQLERAGVVTMKLRHAGFDPRAAVAPCVASVCSLHGACRTIVRVVPITLVGVPVFAIASLLVGVPVFAIASLLVGMAVTVCCTEEVGQLGVVAGLSLVHVPEFTATGLIALGRRQIAATIQVWQPIGAQLDWSTCGACMSTKVAKRVSAADPCAQRSHRHRSVRSPPKTSQRRRDRVVCTCTEFPKRTDATLVTRHFHAICHTCHAICHTCNLCYRCC